MKEKIEFNKKINIGKVVISENSPVFIVAEAGVNHNGDVGLAKKLIDIALVSGANAVKFQAFRTDNLILKDVKKAPYQLATTDSKESQFNMLKRLELTKKMNIELKEYCENKGMLFLITPFDDISFKELDELDLPAYKISSTDLTNLPFLKKVAARKKPIILSTGLSYMSEVEAALKEIGSVNRDVILLQCSSNYPVPDEEVNLKVLVSFKEKFDIITGFSDHTYSIGASPYAVILGAKVVEKHFTLDKKMKGPDHRASLSPGELTEYISAIRRAERYIGSGLKEPTISERGTRPLLQKYLVAARKIKKGKRIGRCDIVAKRTGGLGISPINYEKVLGMVAKKDYQKDDVI